MKAVLPVVVLLTYLAVVKAVTVKQCDDNIPSAIKFVAEGCDELPCPLVRGTTTNANTTFVIPHDTETSKISIKAFALGIWVDFPPADNNVCNNLVNAYCPLEEGEVVTYNLRIPVSKFYPKLSLELKLTFLDEEGEPMACLQVPCKVVDP